MSATVIGVALAIVSLVTMMLLEVPARSRSSSSRR
jgi:hypothetical protein